MGQLLIAMSFLFMLIIVLAGVSIRSGLSAILREIYELKQTIQEGE